MAISVKLCSGRTGYEVTTGTKIDLIKASKTLRTKVATKHLLILDHNGIDVSMYPSGRMIIKIESKERSIEVAMDLLAKLGLI